MDIPVRRDEQRIHTRQEQGERPLGTDCVVIVVLDC